MTLTQAFVLQMTIVASTVFWYNLYTHRRSFKLYRWWIGGLWVKHNNSDWLRCLWLIEPDKGYVVDEKSAGYHLTLKTVVKFENYTKEGCRI